MFLFQVVALVVEHGDQGSIALILNRPTSMILGKSKPNGMPMQLSVGVQVSNAGDLPHC